MFQLLQNRPLALPFTDWLAQVSRSMDDCWDWERISKLPYWRSLYDCGYTPQRAARAYLED